MLHFINLHPRPDLFSLPTIDTAAQTKPAAAQSITPVPFRKNNATCQNGGPRHSGYRVTWIFMPTGDFRAFLA